ncbi:Rrf2 family transcriptional regulator [Akkermansiaceae bacterium]|nr:Rrf2 family transcriptional regulator [Akkermansiaceae bacterium]
MFGYGKMSGCAVAAVSALAEVHGQGLTLSSAEIAASRNFSQALVAKILTRLSQKGFVVGTRGPGGGYRLAMDPGKVTLHQIVEVFEGHRDTSGCPFGPGWCGTGDPCPLHDALVAMQKNMEAKLRKLTFKSFIAHPKGG